MGVGAGATFAWIGVFFLYLSTFATLVVSADPQCIFCQLVQEREDLGGRGAMERNKATTHVGSWLSLSCVPSPAKQVLRLLIHSVCLHPQSVPVLEDA